MTKRNWDTWSVSSTSITTLHPLSETCEIKQPRATGRALRASGLGYKSALSGVFLPPVSLACLRVYLP